MSEDLVLVERDDPIAVVLLNRPKQLNALSDELMDALVGSLRHRVGQWDSVAGDPSPVR